MSDSRFPAFHGSIVQGALGALVLSLFASPASALTLAAAAAADLDAAVAADSLGNPTDVAELPDGRIVVIEKGGNIKTFTPGTDDPAVDKITLVTGGQNEQGLLSVVADPDFATNQFIYLYASVNDDVNNRHKVLRYKLGADGKLSAMKPVIDMGLMGPANHNGSGLSIYGGNLFVGVGDTGKNNATPHNHFGSCLNHANGKILRVSLAEATLGQPPADNPLMNVDMVTGCDDSGPGDDAPFALRPPEKRVYAWGFRNPFRIWADPTNGKLWVGDVGEEKKEEIDVVEKGKHYGYPFFEGSVAYTKQQQAFQPEGTCNGMTPKSECVAPVGEHDRGGGGAIMGGRILDGCGWPAAWKSRYIYGDHEQNKVWTRDVNATRDGLVANSVKDFATTNGVTAMRMGTDNALYIVERGAGRVTRITAKAAPAATPGSCLTTNPAPSNGAGGGGTGGAGAGGASGNGAGGEAPAGGSESGTAGSTATGGKPSGTAGSSISNPGAGTSSSTAGNTGNPGDGTNGADDAADSSGCGCRFGGKHETAALGLGALLSALGLVLGRRRSRKS